jgi:uncharacterized protein (TIGR00730 family)
MAIRTIAVFCGSNSGANPLFEKHACLLGKLLADQNIHLIYGGGKKGLMGSLANAVLENGGTVTGVIPKFLTDWEQQHEGLTSLLVVPDMHERKKKLYELCDAAILMPGGNGSLDEFFEMLTWNTLNIHNKKIIILNSNGFYEHLIAHLHRMDQEQFLYEDPMHRIKIVDSPEMIFSSDFF